MSFEMDLETFNDLEVFAEGEGRESIFSQFNATRTEGGKKALKEIMGHPTSDSEKLSGRRETMVFFHAQKLELEVTYNQLDMIEHYLIF